MIESYDELLWPEVFLPSQLRPRGPQSPERNLALAVFESAWQELHHLRKAKRVDELVRYFFGPDSGTYSLRSICDLFEWSIDAIREAAACAALYPRSAWRGIRNVSGYCRAGHKLTTDNIIRSSTGYSRCRECQRQFLREHRLSKGAGPGWCTCGRMAKPGYKQCDVCYTRSWRKNERRRRERAMA